MKKLFLTLSLVLEIINLYSQTTFLEGSSTVYSDLTDGQKSKYDTLNRQLPTGFQIYFITIHQLDSTKNDEFLNVDLTFLGLEKLQFQPTYVKFNSNNDYAWNGNAIDTNISCLSEECDTLLGDTTAFKYLNGSLTVTSYSGEKSGHLIIGENEYNIVDLSNGKWIMYPVTLPENWCGVKNDTIDEEHVERTPGECESHKLRIFFLYTPKALSKATSMGTTPYSVASQSVTQMQGAWNRSQIGGAYDIVLVGVESLSSHQISFTENTNNIVDIRDELQNLNNNFHSDLETIRNSTAVSADIIIILTDGDYHDAHSYIESGVTIAGYPHPYKSLAYAIVELERATSGFVFAHEVGHIFGALHDIPNDNLAQWDYMHGHHFSLSVCCGHFLGWCTNHCTENFSDIMAYNLGSWSNAIKIQNYSNPNVYYVPGYQFGQTGVSNSEDNARKINNDHDVVQDFLVETYNFAANLSIDPVRACDEYIYGEVSNNCPSISVNYQWYISSTGLGYTPISGANSSTLYYQISLNHGFPLYRHIKCRITDGSGNLLAEEFGNFVIPTCHSIGTHRKSKHEFDKNMSITFYPNPVSKEITISILSEANQFAKFEIYNSLGEKVNYGNQTLVFGKNNIIFNTENLAKGIYLIKFLTTTNSTCSKFLKL